MKNYWLLFAFSILILAVAWLKLQPQSGIKPSLKIGDKAFIEINIADTDQERTLGYSGHSPIGFNEGLLFVFDRPDIYPFWMNDMLFDLDFVMIKDGRITELVEQIKAPKNNKGRIDYVIAKQPFDQLLEVKSGFIKKYNLQIDDEVSLIN